MEGYITLENVTVVRETSPGKKDDGALYCKIDGNSYWIPKKLIHDDSEVYEEGTSGNLIIPEWFAEKEEIE